MKSQLNKDENGNAIVNIYPTNRLISLGSHVEHIFAYEWACEVPEPLEEGIHCLLDYEAVISYKKIRSVVYHGDIIIED